MVIDWLNKQFVEYDIIGGETSGVIYTTNSIFFVVPTKSNLATVARGSMLPTVLRKSMIVYGSL